MIERNRVDRLDEEALRKKAEEVPEDEVTKGLVEPTILMRLEIRNPNDLVLAYAAVLRSPRHFKFLRAEFRELKFLARIALAVHPGASKAPPVLSYVGQNCAEDKELVLIAVEYWPVSLQYASAELQSDREVVLIAVKGDGNALEFASPDLRADRELVLEAVNEKGLALKFALGGLNEDAEVVLKALSKHWNAWHFVGPGLSKDKETCLRATRIRRGIDTPYKKSPNFLDAVECAIACPGDETVVIQVLLSTLQTDNGLKVCCAASMMSGFHFELELLPTANVKEFADRCRRAIKDAQVFEGNRIFITLKAGINADDDDSEWTPLTPFDAPRCIMEFFPGGQALEMHRTGAQGNPDVAGQAASSSFRGLGVTSTVKRINKTLPPQNRVRHQGLTSGISRHFEVDIRRPRDLSF
mmetsp:Transcript_73955/g.154137  ORF Transcript_73955/g.154137 Transcript_73955/m.154137 type:complete len:413 (-) Transcript_73955:74-1312(-)